MPTVLISGVFDPLHAGHVAYVDRALRMGVVTAVVSDDPAKHPPLLPLWHRRQMLRRIGCSVSNFDSVADEIWRSAPDFYMKGREWEGQLPAEIVVACKRTGTKVVYCDIRVDSSSALLANYERARNTERLAAFEAFVQQQQPATEPWTPVLDWSYETRAAIEKPNALAILEAIGPRRVLDAGAGSGVLMHLLASSGTCMVRGFDHIPWGGGNILQGDLADPHLALQPDGYDLVICREVLEHLTVRQIAVAVRNLVRLSSKYVYVTTRFSAKSHLLDIDGGDDLDPTHISLLNQDFLRTLFVLEGCTRRADLEAVLDHAKKGRVLVYEVPRD